MKCPAKTNSVGLSVRDRTKPPALHVSLSPTIPELEIPFFLFAIFLGSPLRQFLSVLAYASSDAFTVPPERCDLNHRFAISEASVGR
jgi:hypothetical protein